MTRGYYRMSSLRRLEVAAHRLTSRKGTSVSRLRGYDFDPEPVLRETDDLVRALPGPPRGKVRWVNVENLGTA